ncbi:MAG: aminopeptidase N [Gammaproteobacteria bacterium]|nr:MAG: aminopeptidase N [Gammaproteobacteria bacterium]
MKDAQPRTIYLKDYRPPAFLVPETHLNVSLHDTHADVTATLTVRRNPKAEVLEPDLTLDGEELELTRIALDGEPLRPEQYQQTSDALIVRNVPDSFTLQTTCRIRPQDNTRLEGLYRSGGMFCTQCEAEGFRRITFFPARPDVLPVFPTLIEADEASCPVLLSNGNPEKHESLPEGRHAAVWHDPYPKPSYLFALVAGKLEAVSDSFTTCSGRNVRLNIYVEPHNLDKCDYAMGALKRAMKWDEEKYGREYDLDLFNIVAVDDFNMGAMENKGLNIFNSSCVLARQDATPDEGFERIEAIVAHEYFHNWSGNRVTCRDWFQLSLKEGFTVYRDACFTADMHSATVKRIDDVNLLRSAQFAEDSGPMAHPVRPDSYIEISNFYTLTVYEKGAEVVRMINVLLGDDLFRKGADLYFERFDGQAVTTDDFVSVMEEVSGRDLSQFKRWYTQAGTPLVEVTDNWNAEKGAYTLNLRQSCPPTPGQPAKEPFHIPFGIALFDRSGRSLPVTEAGDPDIQIELTQAEHTFTFKGMKERPIPSLNRGFTAPIRLDYDWTPEQLRVLIEHDTDGFNRWDAMQTLAQQTISAILVRSGDTEPLLQTLGEAFRGCLKRAEEDPALTARLLQLPSVSWLRDQWVPCDIQQLLASIGHVEDRLAKTLKGDFEAVFNTLSNVPETLTSEGFAGRALRNTCLRWIVRADPETGIERAREQMQSAATMSSELGALKAMLLAGHRPEVQHAVDRFREKWSGDLQVMELWMSAQASEPCWADLDKVQSLTLHPPFSETHPNSVRAVVGRFGAANWKHFHQVNGEGYRWLRKWVVRLDTINPQVAARIITPLTQWAKYTQPYSQEMVKELALIRQHPGLSRDVYEIVTKSLQEAPNRTLG